MSPPPKKDTVIENIVPKNYCTIQYSAEKDTVKKKMSPPPNNDLIGILGPRMSPPPKKDTLRGYFLYCFCVF